MGVDSFREDILRPLRRLARENHLAVVLGAGASVAAGLPTWSKLVEGLLARPDLPPGASQDLAELLLRTQGYLLGAEAAFDAGVSAVERKRRIAKALFQGQSRDDFKPTFLHFAVVALAQARGPGHIQLFTTNYDDLLERAFELFHEPCQSRREFRETADGRAFTVQHLHGLLGRRRGRRYLESRGLVLTQADYDRIYRPENDWPGEALAQAAARGPLLFLGSSLTDPNLVRYLNRIKDRRLEPHVLVLSRQGRLPDERWKYELAVPVRVPGRDGYPALIAGALSVSAATLEEKSKKPWAERMEQLSASWSSLLEELPSRG